MRGCFLCTRAHFKGLTLCSQSHVKKVFKGGEILKLKINFENKTVTIDNYVKPYSKVQLLAKAIDRTISDYAKDEKLQRITIKQQLKTIFKAGLWVSKPKVVAIYNWRFSQTTYLINDSKLENQVRSVLLKHLRGDYNVCLS